MADKTKDGQAGRIIIEPGKPPRPATKAEDAIARGMVVKPKTAGKQTADSTAKPDTEQEG